MKLIKSIGLGSLALAAVSAASAAVTTLHITGSTAFRKAEYAAIADYLANVASVGNTLPNPV